MSMRMAGWLTRRLIGNGLVLILAAPTAKAAATPWQDAVPARQEQSAPSGEAQETGIDGGNGKPVVSSAQSVAPLPDAPEVAQSSSTGGSNGSNGSSQPSQDQQQPVQDQQQPSQEPQKNDQQQNGTAQPVGTAAAPAVKGTGVSGSRVSGAAIAPAKQRRVRTFLISIAVVVAAGVAVGTVVGLSHTSPSQPR
jgi:hypothetical protein